MNAPYTTHPLPATVRRIVLAAAAAMAVFAAVPADGRGRDADTLRILAIGNSFSDDAMEYLPALLDNLGVRNVELARLYVAGCSLERHARFYLADEAPYRYFRSAAGENRWVEAARSVSLRQALAEGRWDIVVLQQASGDSGRYETYRPHLDTLVAAVKRMQPRARLAWHMTWAYAACSTHARFADYGHDQRTMFDSICRAVTAMLDECPRTFSRVIPSGTVIQSLRMSAVNNLPKDFTRDGYHMDYGAGRYALACTWYETLIRPFTHRSMTGNTLLSIWGDMKVDVDTAAYCQSAARQASRHGTFKARPVKKPRPRRIRSAHFDVVSQDMTVRER